MLVGLKVGIHLPRSAKLVNSYQYWYWFAVNLFGQWKTGIAFRVAHIVWFVVSHLERCVEHAENRRRKVLAWEGVVFDGPWFAKPRESIRNHCEGFMDECEIVFLSRHSTCVCLSVFISIDVGDLLIVAVAVLITQIWWSNQTPDRDQQLSEQW